MYFTASIIRLKSVHSLQTFKTSIMKKILHLFIFTVALLFFTTETIFAQPTLLKDIFLGPESSIDFISFKKLGNKLLFTANDGIHGTEFWLTDGTTAGTIRMVDNNEDLNDTYYYFSGRSGSQGLWKTNGTTAGTVLIRDGFTYLSRLTNVNGTFYFVADINANNKEELWTSDGTTAGTFVVKKLRPNSFNTAYTNNLIAAPNGTDLLFTGNDGSGLALWKTTGTTAGTSVVKYFTNTPQYRFGNFINYNGEVYFSAYNPSTRESFWKTDGTLSGTTIVYNNLNFGSIANVAIKVFNNKMYFGAIDDASQIYGNELWVSDGTFSGTNLLYDINPGTAFSSPINFDVVNNTLVFDAIFGEIINKELWRTDGTANGTFTLEDGLPGATAGLINRLPAVTELNRIFFTGFDGDQRMLWETDGTAEGTVALYDISESDLPMITNIGYINNRLIFIKETVANGKELWSFNTTLSSSNFEDTATVKIYPNPVSTELNIEVPFSEIYSLHVINSLGQVVLEKQNNNGETIMDISTLLSGIYFLKISTANEPIQTLKFIKN